MNTELDNFETRLLAELRADVHAPPHSPQTSITRLVALGAVAAGAAAAGLVLLPGLGAQPAYSVQEGNAGEITVEVDRLEDAAGLEAALADHGVAADVHYLPWGQACAGDRFRPTARAETDLTASFGEGVTITIPPGAVRDGETFVMWVSGERIPHGHRMRSEFDIADGPVAPCRVVTADD